MLGDLTEELVPEHNRVRGTLEVVVPDLGQDVGQAVGVGAGVQIRAADATPTDLKQHLPLARSERGQVDHLEHLVVARHRSHRAAPARSRQVAAFALIGMSNWVAWWYVPGRGGGRVAISRQLVDTAMASVMRTNPAGGELSAVIGHMREELDVLSRMLSKKS